MNRQEARRYAHKLVMQAIEQLKIPKMHVDDFVRVSSALAVMSESHGRFGPRTDDSLPRPDEYKGEPLPFSEPIKTPHVSGTDKGVCSKCGQTKQICCDGDNDQQFCRYCCPNIGDEDHADDPNDHICRCNGRLPHAPGTVGQDGQACALESTAEAQEIAE